MKSTTTPSEHEGDSLVYSFEICGAEAKVFMDEYMKDFDE